MGEVVLAYEHGVWKVQLLTNGHLATQVQFQYAIYPTPDNPIIGFIIENHGQELSRILFYDLKKRINFADGSFRYCGLAELARFQITATAADSPVGIKSNSLATLSANDASVDFRGSANVQLTPEVRAFVDQMYVEMFSYVDLPQEPVIFLTQSEFFAREQQMRILQAEQQKVYAAYVAAEEARRKLQIDIWQRAQENLAMMELMRKLRNGVNLRKYSSTNITGVSTQSTSEHCQAKATKPALIDKKVAPSITTSKTLANNASDSKKDTSELALPPAPKSMHKKVKKDPEEQAAQQLQAAKERIIDALCQPKIEQNKLIELINGATILRSRSIEQLSNFVLTINFPIELIELLISKDDKLIPVKFKIALLNKVPLYSNQEYDKLRQPLNLVNKINALAKHQYATTEETKFIQNLKSSLKQQYDHYVSRMPKKAAIADAKPVVADKPTKPPKPMELLVKSLENLNAIEVYALFSNNPSLKGQLASGFNEAFSGSEKNFDFVQATQLIQDLDVDVKFCLKILNNPKINITISAALLQKLMQFDGLKFFSVYQHMDKSEDFELMLEEIKSLYPEVIATYNTRVADAQQAAVDELTRLLRSNPPPSSAQIEPYIKFIDVVKIDGDNALVYAVKNFPPELVLTILKISTDDMVLTLDEQQRSILHVFANSQPTSVKLFYNLIIRYHEALAKLYPCYKINNMQAAMQYLQDDAGKTFLDVLLAKEASQNIIANLLHETSRIFTFNQHKYIVRSWLQLIPVLMQKGISLLDPISYKQQLDAHLLILRQMSYADTLLMHLSLDDQMAPISSDNKISQFDDIFSLKHSNNIVAQLIRAQDAAAYALLQQIIKARLALRSELNVSTDPKLLRIYLDNDIKHILYRMFERDLTPGDLAIAKKIIKIDAECYLDYFKTCLVNDVLSENPERLQLTILQTVLADMANSEIELNVGNKILDVILATIKGDADNEKHKDRLLRFVGYEDGKGRTCLDYCFSILVIHGVNAETISVLDKLLAHGASLDGDNIDGLNNLFGENILHRLFLDYAGKSEATFDYLCTRFNVRDIVHKLQEKVNAEEEMHTPIEILKNAEQSEKLAAFIAKLESMVKSPRLQHRNLM